MGSAEDEGGSAPYPGWSAGRLGAYSILPDTLTPAKRLHA